MERKVESGTQLCVPVRGCASWRNTVQTTKLDTLLFIDWTNGAKHTSVRLIRYSKIRGR